MCRLRHFCFLLFWLLTISEKNYVRCACEGSVVVFCERITDIRYLPSEIIQSWKELIVGDVKQVPQYADGLELYILVTENSHRDLEKLTLINQFNDSVLFSNQHASSLKSVTFYGNNMKQVEVRVTELFSKGMDILSFHHNNIENIKFEIHSTFEGIITVLDLSYNQLNSSDGCLFPDNLRVAKLILSYNNLVKIRPRCLPKGLKHLYLDHNQFVYFSTINPNVHNLSQLEYLTVAHNKLEAIDDLPVLDSLSNLDLSFNNLNYIPDIFRYCGKLRTLNLRHNNLITFTFPNLNRDLKDIHFIDLAFNHLRNVDPRPIKNYTVEVVLFGNPWNCRCRDNLRKYKLYGTRLVEKTPCHYRFPDYVPYCVISDKYNERCSSEAISDVAFDFFRNVTRNFVDFSFKECFQWHVQGLGHRTRRLGF